MTSNRTRQTRWTVIYTTGVGDVRSDEILAISAAVAAEHARTHIADAITITDVVPAAPRPRKSRKPAKVADGFDAWAASAGELATTHVNGFEVVDNEHGTRDGRPMFETIAEFAFAIEVAAAGPGQLFA